MFFRVKHSGSYGYLQIVESFREQGQVRQRVLSTLGRLDALQASGQLDVLLRSGLDNLQEIETVFQSKHFVLRSEVVGQAHKAFRAVGVALPPILREKA